MTAGRTPAEQLVVMAPDPELVSFAKAMEEEQGAGFDVFYFLEKPWKWSGEYARWVAAGRPPDPGWNREPAHEASA